MDFILELANITEREVGIEELTRVPDDESGDEEQADEKKKAAKPKKKKPAAKAKEAK